ncbi:Peptidase inhibitor family I36 [Actinopolyspora lacussalsi subsp. righensis]|uniref:Peptidase inhibitor family I36 n=1 Tax=Actinopolyspora righensis TaxID=995060 RepID=A0A1I6Y736_9ACTN|nr:peptidase inhibitor family I36 protein [Actinopolyspora righensis]SFT46157.1 Peptidase inhibitor family I36 [Actinopolyspora righensis]
MLTRDNGTYPHHGFPRGGFRVPVVPRVRRVLFPLLAALLLGGSVQPLAAGAVPGTDRPCDVGVFCAWSETDYAGNEHSSDLRGTNMEECVRLNGDIEARSFVNRMDRPVTVYQDARCATSADFSTYPGGSFVPRAPYVVRAIKVWTH